MYTSTTRREIQYVESHRGSNCLGLGISVSFARDEPGKAYMTHVIDYTMRRYRDRHKRTNMALLLFVSCRSNSGSDPSYVGIRHVFAVSALQSQPKDIYGFRSLCEALLAMIHPAWSVQEFSPHRI